MYKQNDMSHLAEIKFAASCDILNSTTVCGGGGGCQTLRTPFTPSPKDVRLIAYSESSKLGGSRST